MLCACAGGWRVWLKWESVTSSNKCTGDSGGKVGLRRLEPFDAFLYEESIKFSFWRLPFAWAAVFPLIRVCAQFPAQGRPLVSLYFFSLAHTCSRSRFHIKSRHLGTGSVPFWQAHSSQFTAHSSQFTVHISWRSVVNKPRTVIGDSGVTKMTHSNDEFDVLSNRERKRSLEVFIEY